MAPVFFVSWDLLGIFSTSTMKIQMLETPWTQKLSTERLYANLRPNTSSTDVHSILGTSLWGHSHTVWVPQFHEIIFGNFIRKQRREKISCYPSSVCDIWSKKFNPIFSCVLFCLNFETEKAFDDYEAGQSNTVSNELEQDCQLTGSRTSWKVFQRTKVQVRVCHSKLKSTQKN